MTELLHWLLLHHIYLGPIYSQAHQTFQAGANGPPVNYLPVMGSRSGGMIPDGVVISGKFWF